METTDQIGSARATYAALLESSLKRVVVVLSGLEGVKRISLVGSYARGRADLFTDLDILVVMETNLSFIDRLRMLYPLLALPVDLDLLCYTPEELERMQDRPFIKHLRREEVVLYETNASPLLPGPADWGEGPQGVPRSIPDSIPARIFTRDAAAEAVRLADEMVTHVADRLGRTEGGGSGG